MGLYLGFTDTSEKIDNSHECVSCNRAENTQTSSNGKSVYRSVYPMFPKSRPKKHSSLMRACCGRQTSVTAGPLYHATKLPLTKWFWAIYRIAADKGNFSTLRLTKLIGASWPTAFAMLCEPGQPWATGMPCIRLSASSSLMKRSLRSKAGQR